MERASCKKWGDLFSLSQLHETRVGAADRGHGVSWDGDQLSKEQESSWERKKGEKAKKREGKETAREDEGSKGESIFVREIGEGSVRLDYLLLYLILF